MQTYLLFNKPYGVLSQFKPEPGSKALSLAGFVKVPSVYAAGRLDHDSEGALLLTDDGEFQHRLTDPKFGHRKTYLAQVEGEISTDALNKLRRGRIPVQDYLTRPAKAAAVPPPSIPDRVPPIRYRAAIPTSWVEIEITEGRNRQVRRMLAAVGFPVLRLIRIAIGDVTLDGLAPGEFRRLSRADALMALAGARHAADAGPA